MRVENVIKPPPDPLAGSSAPGPAWTLDVDGETVQSASRDEDSSQRPGGNPSLLLPPLCHPHIHLDKAYLLRSPARGDDADWPYSDLQPRSGSFAEALRVTDEAKKRFTPRDLDSRGRQLVVSSFEHGVTSMRAFVEVDETVQLAGLASAVRLKRDSAPRMHIQICVFAQDSLFSAGSGENRAIMERALREHRADIDAVGTAPYVEETREASLRNIHWAVDAAIEHALHLDFHLDYNLDDPRGEDTRPLVHDVVARLRARDWNANTAGKTVALGHCTQMTRFTKRQLGDLTAEIKTHKLPVHFVGLPTSDLYMMGRTAAAGAHAEPELHHKPRGTLPVLALIRDCGLEACLGVNNVGNAFTPYGTGDPLQLASQGVGLYHAGTAADAKTLYGCVSWRARRAIGLSLPTDPDPAGGSHDTDSGGFEAGERILPALLIDTPAPAGGWPWVVPSRPRLDYKDVVWDPPPPSLRRILAGEPTESPDRLR